MFSQTTIEVVPLGLDGCRDGRAEQQRQHRPVGPPLSDPARLQVRKLVCHERSVGVLLQDEQVLDSDQFVMQVTQSAGI